MVLFFSEPHGDSQSSVHLVSDNFYYAVAAGYSDQQRLSAGNERGVCKTVAVCGFSHTLPSGR